MNENEWGEFLHIPNEKLCYFNKIRSEIVRGTGRRRDAVISTQPIHLRIFSPNVLTLTLVDFPGFMKLPVGDEPKDIEKLIRDMPSKYISKPAYIILGVTPANADLVQPRWSHDGPRGGPLIVLEQLVSPQRLI